MYWIKRIVVAATVCAAAFGAGAQETNSVPPDKGGYNLFNPTPDKYMREISPDRPDKTDSPFTVDAGHFQVEMDFANFTYDSPHSENGNVKTEDYQIAPMNLRVGVLNDVDLQLEMAPWTWQRITDKTTGAVETGFGFGEITPRATINLIGNDGGFFAIGLVPYVTFPTAQDNLGSGAYEGGVEIPYAFNVPHWDIALQTAVACDHDVVGNGYHADIANSISIGHTVIGPLEYHVEFYSSVSTEQNSDWIGTFDTWFTYQVNKNIVLDGGVYIGVTPAADDWHPWVGMTWRY